MLTRDQILSAIARQRNVELVEVAQWGGSVGVSVMSGNDRDEWELKIRSLGKDDAVKRKRALMLALCLVDENRQKLFTLDDIEALGQEDAPLLDRLVTVAERVNVLTDEAMEDVKGNS